MATTKRTRTTTSAKAEPKSGKVARVTTQAVDIQRVIRSRAYELYQERGGGHGRDHEDWLRAEAEVMSRFGQSA